MIKIKNNVNSLANALKIGYVDESGSFKEFSKVFEVTGNGTKRTIYSKASEPEEDIIEFDIDIYGDDAAFVTDGYVTVSPSGDTHITTAEITVNSYPIGEVFITYNGEHISECDYYATDYHVSATYYGEANGVAVTPYYNSDMNVVNLEINFSYA